MLVDGKVIRFGKHAQRPDVVPSAHTAKSRKQKQKWKIYVSAETRLALSAYAHSQGLTIGRVLEQLLADKLKR